jgi:AbrB family looped-hinge helix DNA binding protein
MTPPKAATVVAIAHRGEHELPARALPPSDEAVVGVDLDVGGVTVILAGMTSRVGLKGQVVIPKALRDRLGILPGDEVDFVLEDGAVRVEPRRGGPDLRGQFAALGLTAALEADRRAERGR